MYLSLVFSYFISYMQDSTVVPYHMILVFLRNTNRSLTTDREVSRLTTFVSVGEKFIDFPFALIIFQLVIFGFLDIILVLSCFRQTIS